jgi:hypothetical protein
MKNISILISALFFVHAGTFAQETPANEAASAYAFVVDSVIIKELNKYPHLKNHRLALTGLQSKYLYDRRMHNGFWNDVQKYYGGDTIASSLDSLLNNAEALDFKNLRNCSIYPDRILVLDTSKGIRSGLMYNANKTMTCLMSNCIFSPNREKAILFYSLGDEGGFTVVLKRTERKWELILKRMDFIY